ncbi:hypothetical protein B0H16DRAFT_1472445 [Mycena metata]|uniref:Uncharacterized protein n=1 Tax=Mycena metata TaxID=1033252 RepID=A0AAD7MN39_9AGAR|nr:hypothetical protein B0H16DRAFT_1472445 [Mycena metata]
MWGAMYQAFPDAPALGLTLTIEGPLGPALDALWNKDLTFGGMGAKNPYFSAVSEDGSTTVGDIRKRETGRVIRALSFRHCGTITALFSLLTTTSGFSSVVSCFLASSSASHNPASSLSRSLPRQSPRRMHCPTLTLGLGTSPQHPASHLIPPANLAHTGLLLALLCARPDTASIEGMVGLDLNGELAAWLRAAARSWSTVHGAFTPRMEFF